MIIAIRNLNFVARAGNFKPYASGVFEKQGVFYVNCCHGGEDGTMSLQVRDRMHEVEPKNMRKLVYSLIGKRIPKKSPIVIHPCFPYMVQKRYTKELNKNNISVVGDWDSITYWCPATLGEFFYPQNRQRLIMTAGSFDLFLSDSYDELNVYDNPTDVLNNSDIIYN